MKNLIKTVFTYGSIFAFLVTTVFAILNSEMDRSLMFTVCLTVSYSLSFSIGTLILIVNRLNLEDRITLLLYIPASILGSIGGVFLSYFILNALLPQNYYFYKDIHQLTKVLPAYIVLGSIGSFTIIFIKKIKLKQIEQKFQLQNEQKKNEQLEEFSKEMKIEALQSRLNPHFLFNTLNVISELIEIDKNLAEKTVLDLSDVYRKTLEISEQKLIPIIDELELLKKYLEIEKIRFAEKLETEIEICPHCEKRLIPPLCLQPFVENAITKGISKKKTGGKVSIIISDEPTNTLISIKDTGVGCEKYIPGGGTSNVINRLDLIYKNNYSLLIESKKGIGTTVTMKIPKEDN